MTKKSPLFIKLARSYVRRRLRKTFADVRLSGADSLKDLISRGPTIFAVNHVAWWDPLVLVHLDAVLRTDGYCLMDARNLKQLPFFGWVGAVPLDRSSSHRAYRDIVEARALLSGTRRFVCIFPHGEQRPAHLPLAFKPGVAALAKNTGCPIVPIAIRYDYLESPRQVVHLSVGEAFDADDFDSTEAVVSQIESRVQEALALIDQELITPTGQFQSLLGRGTSSNAMHRIPAGASALKLLSRSGSP